MSLKMCGADYSNASLESLEKCVFQKSDIPAFIAQVKANTPIQELVLLSTCNRVELYYWVTGTHPAPAEESLLSEIAKFKNMNAEDIKSLFNVQTDLSQTLHHLFSVSSGIKSMVFGENEILGQVKAAYELSKENGGTSTHLNKIFQQAIAAGKRVRSESDISKGAYSISSIAIEAIRERLSDYLDKKILILGAGTMGLRSLKKLSALDHKHIYITNRSEDKKDRLSEKYPVNWLPYADLHRHINIMDIVILATGSTDYIIDKSSITESGPELIVDLGIPRNAHPNIDTLPHCDLISLYSLQEIAEKNIQNKQNEMGKIQAILADEEARLMKWHSYKETQCKKDTPPSE